MKTWVFSFIFLAIELGFAAASRQTFSGRSVHRFYNFTAKDAGGGLDNWLSAEQKTEWDGKNSGVFQLFGYAGSRRYRLHNDIDTAERKNLMSEVRPGDFYLQRSESGHLIKLGYQTILWQEGFGPSYTNFINGRDYQVSFFDPNYVTYFSAPALNWIYSLGSFSAQLIYLPISQFDRYPPPSRSYLSGLTSLGYQKIEIQNPQSVSADNEAGLRLSWAGASLDFSIFYFQLKDRSLYFTVAPESTVQNLILKGQHTRKVYSGFSTSVPFDAFLIRLEAVKVNKRDFNTFTGGQLGKVEADDLAATLTLDKPSMDGLAASLQISSSTISDYDVTAALVRKKVESLAAASLVYNIKSDRRVSLQSIIFNNDNSNYSRVGFAWPVSGAVEGELAYEVSSGKNPSIGRLSEDLNNVYFQLTNVF
jgi:hypothetical protein